MESIEWSMMAAFAAAVLFSLWKIYAFVPKKPLADDDTTPQAVEALTEVMLACIREAFDNHENPDEHSLYEKMLGHERFDKEHFWRFNHNRLNQLLRRYYLLHPGVSSLRDIYLHQKRAR